VLFANHWPHSFDPGPKSDDSMTLRLYRPGTSVSTSSFVIEVPLASASGFADVSCVAVIKAQASKLGINGAHAAAAAAEGGGEAATAAVGATSSSSGAGAEAPPPPLQFKTKPRANALESIIEKLERRYASNVFFTNEVDEEEDDEDEEEEDDDEEGKGDNGRGDRPSSTAPPPDGADPDPTAAAAAAAASTGAPAQDAAKKKKKKRPAVPEFYESDDGFVDDDEVRTYCGALQRQTNPFPRTHASRTVATWPGAGVGAAGFAQEKTQDQAQRVFRLEWGAGVGAAREPAAQGRPGRQWRRAQEEDRRGAGEQQQQRPRQRQ